MLAIRSPKSQFKLHARAASHSTFSNTHRPSENAHPVGTMNWLRRRKTTKSNYITEEVESVAIKRRGFRDALGEVPPAIAESKRPTLAACLAHAVLLTYVMITCARILSIHDIHCSYRYVSRGVSDMHQRRAWRDPRVSISCVKWPRAQDTQLALAIVVFHVRNSVCWSQCHKTEHHALRHTFHANTLDLVARRPSASVAFLSHLTGWL